MAITYTVFDQELSEAVPTYVARLDALLLSLGPIGLQDVALSKRLRMNTIRYELTLQYSTPGPAQFRAVCFEAQADVDVDALANAFFAAHPTYRIHFLLDVSLERRRNALQNSIMAIYADSVIPNCGSDRSRPVVVQAVDPIAAGDTGLVAQVAASGVLGIQFEVVNRSGFTWPSGGLGYASARMGTCVWDGYATCCDASTTTTSTTSSTTTTAPPPACDTWDPTFNSANATFSNGDRTLTLTIPAPGYRRFVRGQTSGIRYCEFVLDSGTFGVPGIVAPSIFNAWSFPGSANVNGGVGYAIDQGFIYQGSGGLLPVGGGGFAPGVVVGMVVDLNGGTVDFYRNDVLINTGGPVPLPGWTGTEVWIPSIGSRDGGIIDTINACSPDYVYPTRKASAGASDW